MRDEVFAVDPRADAAVASAAGFTLLCCGVVSVTDPGILLGAVAAWWAIHRYAIGELLRWVSAGALAALAVGFRDGVVVGWPWRLAASSWMLLRELHVPEVGPSPALAKTVFVELLAGPLASATATFGLRMLDRTIVGRLRYQRRAARKRRFAVSGPRVKPKGSINAPANAMVLGVDRESRRPFELSPSELEQHVFIPGASGSGKTTTLARLAFEAMRMGFGIVMIDCKGGADLKDTARKLAHSFRWPFYVVDPDDEDSLGYDPCTGDGSDVSNRLIGSFTFGQNAEIYKMAAQNILPVLVEALKSQRIPITLSTLEQHLDPGPLVRLAHDCPERIRYQLIRLSKPQGAAADGYAGFQLRLGALIRGKFGPLLDRADEQREILDWDRATATPAVTYLPLRATASAEDVELMGRVIAQDLKQVISRRLRKREKPQPVLVVVDEFAALREAEQYVDLLLQARQAAFSVVLATQYIPETESIRKAALSAGLLIVHRLEGSDAEDVANQFGTKSHYEDVVQIGPDGPTGLRSVRLVDAFRVHPNDLRDMKRGFAAVRSVSTERRAIVQVEPI